MTDPFPALWRLELLGELRLVRLGASEVDGPEIGAPNAAPTHFRSRKTAALLAYLALRRGAHRRESLGEMFWPDTDARSARNSLRVALSSLRALLEPEGVTPGAVLTISREFVALGPALRCDVEAFRDALQTARTNTDPETGRAALQRALECYRGPLAPLDEIEGLLMEADRLEDEFVLAQSELLAGYEARGEWKRALEIARVGQKKAPWREEIALDVLRFSVQSGAPEAARDFKRWCARAQKHGVAVSGATLQRAHELERGKGATGMRQGRNLVPLAANSGAVRTRGLPDAWAAFFGRETEIAELQRALSGGSLNGARLTTLIGPGGSGKTRLALQVARGLAAHPAAEFGLIVWVSGAELPVASLLSGAIEQALGRSPRQKNVRPVVAALDEGNLGRGSRILLVLDGFEHLCDDGAPLVREWLESMPELACLLTSRRALGFTGEVRHQVLPLETGQFQPALAAKPGALNHILPADTWAHNLSAASALFLDRARLARSGWLPSPQDLAAAARLCACFEGLPLALEIAAARSTLFSPAQILAEIGGGDSDSEIADLSGALGWKNPDRAAPAHHATLRASLAWGERQLPVVVARFWAQISVFRGGVTLEAASQVCGCEAAPLLMALAEMSLLRFDTRGETRRAVQLEIARQYAAQSLSETERGVLAEKHARYFGAWLGARPDSQQIEAEQWNLRSAQSWFLEHAPERAPQFDAALDFKKDKREA